MWFYIHNVVRMYLHNTLLMYIAVYMKFSIVNKSSVVAYGELQSDGLYGFAMMDTRKGQPQANGIMPSLLVLDYHVTTNTTEKNSCMLQCVCCNMTLFVSRGIQEAVQNWGVGLFFQS